MTDTLVLGCRCLLLLPSLLRFLHLLVSILLPQPSPLLLVRAEIIIVILV
jgi:hypothetical protein